MNERIKAIGQQAGFAFIEDGVYGQRWYSSKCGMDASEFEKFAELIVKECIGAISEVKESFFEFRLETDDFTEKIRFFAGEDACNQSVRKIETLFGVEE